MNDSQLKEAAIRLATRYRLSQEEAENSLARSLRYFLDCNYDEKESWEKALELVETAVYSARENNFNLRGMVDHLLFSRHHRSQNGVRRY